MSQLTIRPTGAGDETNQVPVGGANWQNVDEEFADDATTYNNTDDSVTEKRDLYTMGDCGLAAGTTINWIRIYMRVNNSGSYGSAKTAIKSGGTVYEGGAVGLSGSWTTSYTQYTTIGGAAITPAMIDAMQGGCSIIAGEGKGDVSGNTQTYILVDYTLTAAGKVQGHVLG